MTLTRGEFRRYDYDRMVVLFTMTNAADEVACAISSAAMDDLDGSTGTKPDHREQQFFKLRDRIEERASRKFAAAELEGRPPGIILRSIDFR
jgi:phage shock protein A